METEATGGGEGGRGCQLPLSTVTEGSVGKARVKPSEFSLLSHVHLTKLFASLQEVKNS